MAAIKLCDVAPIELLEHIRQKARNRVHRVGVELEGGWSKLPKGTHPVRDGSVEIAQTAEEPLVLGEIVSPPLDLTAFPTWVKAFYPQKMNGTCGMHVHLSFRTALTYQRLMTPTYPATIVAYIRQWAETEKLGKKHPIWPRLRGESEFCQHVYQADAQSSTAGKDYDHHRTGHRYTVINYCYNRHSTVECRLLPMFDTPEQAVKAVREVIDITNAYLLATGRREEKIEGKAMVERDEEKETRRIYA